MPNYRIAIIGCGPRGRAQARAVTQHPRTDLVALCDLAPERLRALGDEMGVAARYSDFAEMIRQEAPDIVQIPTATRFHAPLAEAVLRMGCHVDVEKPLTLTLAELDGVLAAQRESGKQLVPHHQAAVHPPVRKLRDLVHAGHIGEPQAIRIRNKGYYGGYGILHQGCHALALAASILGPARAVSAHMVTAGQPTTVDDILAGPAGYGLVAGENLTCLYEMERGVYIINEEHQRVPVDSGTIRFEVVGTEGSLALDRAIARSLYHTSAVHWHPTEAHWSEVTLTPAERAIAGIDYTDAAASSMDLWLVEEWVRALDEGRDPVIDAAVGAATMEMIHGAFAAHAERRRIDLPQTERDHPLERWLRREGRPMPPPAPTEGNWTAWAMAQGRRQG